MTEGRPLSLEEGLAGTTLSVGDLWLRYFALGGNGTADDVDAFVHGALRPPRIDHDLLTLALNEELADLGKNHPLLYAPEQRPE